jgi:catechol 2,3-dioxygenase-like lactoylglutathione lyase family enzyme
MSQPISLKTKVITPKFDETRDWYRDLFGLAMLEEWDEPGDKGCILGLPGAKGEAFLEIYYAEGQSDFAGLSLQWRVDDVASFAIPDEPRFAHRGPEPRPWGSSYVFLTDPNGIVVIIFTGTSL